MYVHVKNKKLYGMGNNSGTSGLKSRFILVPCLEEWERVVMYEVLVKK